MALSLFDPAGVDEQRLDLERLDGDLWRAYAPGVGPGQLYGYRIDGPYEPASGHRFNPAKLLVDPWTRAVSGTLRWHPSVHGFDRGRPDGPVPDEHDSAPNVPRCVVVDPQFEWGDDRPPAVPWRDTVIYEAHVRGLTRLHPEVPPEQRGTYLGLRHPAVIEHLLSLGVTAIELLPVQHYENEQHLARAGLTNYWGYSPLAFFAPHAGYASGSRGEQVQEFRRMVRDLHAAGIEVLLDVVFNHTIEGDHRGPTLSLRGVDNSVYYRLDDADRGRYVDFTGCGNTLDASHEHVVDLVIESLRYWVEEMHVDGFRFDLATVLGRDPIAFDDEAAFFRRVEEEPSLRGVKWIAEPWDLGEDGHQLGNFPPGWAQWNDRSRDTIRALWRGDAVPPERLARSLGGSMDLLAVGRSIDYVTSHDGFTLADRVSYRRKHNWANREHNRDGSDHDLSTNWGVEGPSLDPQIVDRRRRAQRALLATLSVVVGVPMIGHGDEIGRSQQGNNNAYCHDGPLTWVDWALDPERAALLRFTRQLFGLRKHWAALRPRQVGDPDLLVEWVSEDGTRHPLDRRARARSRVGVLLERRAADDLPITVLLLVNAGQHRRHFVLPRLPNPLRWLRRIDSVRPEVHPELIEGTTVGVGVIGLVALEAVSLDPEDAGSPQAS